MSNPPLFTPRPTVYRAWDRNHMVTVQTLCWNQQGMIWYGPGNKTGWAFVYPDSTGWDENNHRPSDADICPVMQWTGLKDRNGRDIYEGDIVRYSIYGDLRSGTVEWADYSDDEYVETLECWMVDGRPLSCVIRSPRPGWGVVQGVGKDSACVIGNLFENPDLLK